MTGKPHRHAPRLNAMSNIVHIRNATVYRGQTLVFRNLSLDVARGEHTAILGPNGAGKTTLLKFLAKDIYPVPQTDCEVTLFGRRQWNVWTLRSMLGMVSHDLQQGYLPSVSGREVVLSGFRSSIGTYAHQKFTKAELRKTEEILGDMDCTSLADRTFGSLSTGQQRRFLLARALVHEPLALLLDEPTSGLDIKACFEYLDTIRKLMSQGKTIILVTHHIHEIPPEMRRVVLLKHGQVLAEGDKASLFTDEVLSGLFGVRLRLLRGGGFYQVVPG